MAASMTGKESCEECNCRKASGTLCASSIKTKDSFSDNPTACRVGLERSMLYGKTTISAAASPVCVHIYFVGTIHHGRAHAQVVTRIKQLVREYNSSRQQVKLQYT